MTLDIKKSITLPLDQTQSYVIKVFNLYNIAHTLRALRILVYTVTMPLENTLPPPNLKIKGKSLNADTKYLYMTRSSKKICSVDIYLEAYLQDKLLKLMDYVAAGSFANQKYDESHSA